MSQFWHKFSSLVLLKIPFKDCISRFNQMLEVLLQIIVFCTNKANPFFKYTNYKNNDYEKKKQHLKLVSTGSSKSLPLSCNTQDISTYRDTCIIEAGYILGLNLKSNLFS